MAEGWARALRSDVIEAYSAGTNPHGMNPLAIRREPLTLEQYLASRYVCEPLRVPDYCLINDGGVALIADQVAQVGGGELAPAKPGQQHSRRVTAGGVNLKEVDSKDMQSKLVPGLHLAGEILDLDGPIGGYNFQAAWSTGWLAGDSV